MQPAEPRARTLSRGRWRCEVRPCRLRAQLHKELRGEVVLQRHAFLLASAAWRVRLQLRLHASLQSRFLHQPPATPRLTRRRELHGHPSKGLRDLTF
jgi:hypothetical protein